MLVADGKHGVRIMTTTRILEALLLGAALFAGSAHAAVDTVAKATAQSAAVTQFIVGDSDCVLKDDRIQCTPTNR